MFFLFFTRFLQLPSETTHFSALFSSLEEGLRQGQLDDFQLASLGIRRGLQHLLGFSTSLVLQAPGHSQKLSCNCWVDRGKPQKSCLQQPSGFLGTCAASPMDASIVTADQPWGRQRLSDATYGQLASPKAADMNLCNPDQQLAAIRGTASPS